MRNKTLISVLALVLSFVAAPAFAAGGYLGVEGGAVWLSDASFKVAGIQFGDVEFDTGYAVGAVGGYNFGTFRLEGEFVYRANDNKQINSLGITDPLGGDTTSMTLMANAYYDFRMVSPTVYPYIGAGIGCAWVNANVTDPTVGGGTVVDDTQAVFAYQFIAGIGFDVTKEFTMTLDYRYFATSDPEFELQGAGGLKADGEYKSNNVMLTLRYNF